MKDNIMRHGTMLFFAMLTANAFNYFYHFAMGRMLGPAEYGILGALFSIIYLLSAPLTALQTIITKFVSNYKAKNEGAKISSLLFRSSRTVLLYSAALFFIFAATSPISKKFLNIDSYAVMLSFSGILMFIFLLASLRGFLQGLQEFKKLGVNLIFETIIKLIAAVALVWLGWKVLGAIWAIMLSLALGLLFAIYYLFPYFRQANMQIDTSEIYRYTPPVFIAMFSATLMYTADVILVKHYFDAVSAGHYAAVSLLAKMIFWASSAISIAMFPKVSESEAKKEAHLHILKKSMFFVFSISTVFVAAYLLFPEIAVSILFGSAYLDVAPLLGIFGLAMGLFSISYVLINYNLALNRTRFIYPLAFLSMLEIALIILFHSSLMQIILIIFGVMALLLASLALEAKLYKQEPSLKKYE